MCGTVTRRDAGNAELGITVTDPNGESVPFDVDKTPTGEVVTYTPNIPGTYKVNMTYGCIEVPGTNGLLCFTFTQKPTLLYEYHLLHSIGI